jgi:hypothetical protein
VQSDLLKPPAPAPPLPALLVSEKEAARLLGGLSSRTVFSLRKRGLPFVKIGARVMFSPTDLAVWIERQRTGITP